MSNITRGNTGKYFRKMGGYQPHFRAKPLGYWPNTKTDIALSALLFLGLALFFTGLCIAFTEWCIHLTTSHFSQVWSILFCIFMVFFFILSYRCSQGFHRKEEKLVENKIKEQRMKIIKEFKERNHVDYIDEFNLVQ
jgi:membrane protein implicated in regulation of membrane protease activity